jgi:hypothetical protein
MAVYFSRLPDVKEYRGFEVQVYSPVDSVYPTGSIYGKQRSTLSADLEGQWMLLQVRLTGSRIVVRVNGETVATYEGLTGRDLQPGRIGLQCTWMIRPSNIGICGSGGSNDSVIAF